MFKQGISQERADNFINEKWWEVTTKMRVLLLRRSLNYLCTQIIWDVNNLLFFMFNFFGSLAQLHLMLCQCSMAMATAMVIWGWQLDDGNRTTMMGQQWCDEDGLPATCRTLASAASSIQSNSQLMWTVLGG
jgi:hypothetical protein